MSILVLAKTIFHAGTDQFNQIFVQVHTLVEIMCNFFLKLKIYLEACMSAVEKIRSNYIHKSSIYLNHLFILNKQSTVKKN